VLVLLAADLHYRLPQYDWLLAVAPEVDAIVIAGDLCDVASPVDVSTQALAVTATLEAIASETLLVTCSGNHDLDGRDDDGEKTSRWLPRVGGGVVVDGTSHVAPDGTTFTSLPWWDGPVARARTTSLLEQEAARRGDGAWIWVYHSPPTSPLSWTGTRHFGDPAVEEWIEQFSPAAVLTGHIHQAPFTPAGDWVTRVGDTWLFNAGQQPGPVPAHVELDLSSGTASWRSYAGGDERAIGALARPTGGR
jgi:Icc-related predicted phosphoesterase